MPFTGDPLFMGFASIHLLANRFFTSQPMADVMYVVISQATAPSLFRVSAYADEIMLDLDYLPKASETVRA